MSFVPKMKLPKVSARIEVYWDWPMTWYKGQVVEIKPGEDEDVVLHRVEYDDGSFSWHNLKQDKWCKEPKYNLLHPQQRWKQWIPKQKDKNPAAKIVCEPEATPFPQADDRIEVYDIERDLWQKGIVIDAGTEGKGHPCVCYDDGATEWLSLNQTPWRRLPSLVQKESSQRLFSGERATFNLKYKYTSPRADSRPAPPPVKPKVHLPPFDVPTAHSPRVKPRAGMSLTLSRHHRTTKSDHSCFSVCVQCSTSSRAWCTTYWSYGRRATRCFTRSIT